VRVWGGAWEPLAVDLNLRRTNWDDVIRTERVSAEKLDEVEAAIARGIATYLDRTA
jgi:hypothetical protein